VLEEGDSLYIPANLEHSFRKVSEEDCVSYWVVPYNDDDKGADFIPDKPN
jgi:quercetin dioxygenase-like cupin family protein